MSTISPLASTIVRQLPALLERLRKYEEQNGELELRVDNLESEIHYMKRKIYVEQEKQRRTKKRIAEAEAEVPHKQKKRPRVDEEILRVVKPRVEGIDEGGVHTQTCPSVGYESSSSVSIGTKRKAWVFSKEADSIMGGQNARLDDLH